MEKTEMELQTIATFLSWAGAVMVLLAFALNIRKKFTTEDKAYIFLNLFGAIFLATSALITKSYAFTVLNSVWALFALYTLLVSKKPR